MGGLCGGMSLTPNSKVSRSVRISANGASLAGFLSRLALDSPPLPVRILFEPEGASCWTMNAGKTLMVMFDKHPIDGLKVKQPCVIICNPKELSDLVRSKSRGETVKVSTEASEPIRITTKSNGGAEIMPADEDDCLTIPDRNILPIADDKRLFPMFENEPATSESTFAITELTKANMEMKTANAPYVVMTFSPTSSEARSGHWNGKTTRSWTPLEATLTGETFTAAFTDTINTVLAVLIGTTDTLKVSKHLKGQFVVIESLSGHKTTIVATEAIKEI